MQVALRRGKPLLALQAVRRAISVAGESHPDVHRITLRLCQRFRPHAEGTQNGTATACHNDPLPAIMPVVSLHISTRSHMTRMCLLSSVASNSPGTEPKLHMPGWQICQAVDCWMHAVAVAAATLVQPRSEFSDTLSVHKG